ALGVGIALTQRPRTAFPAFVLFTADDFGQVHAFEPWPFLCLLEQRWKVELPLLVMGDHRVRRPAGANAPGERARIDAREADLALLGHPFDELALGAEVGMASYFLAHDAADCAFDVRFNVLGIGADVADVRKGEGD